MHLLKNLSIRYKLLGGFFLIIFILIGFSVNFFINLNILHNSFTEQHDQFEKVRLLSLLDTDTKQLSDSVKSYILTKNSHWVVVHDQTNNELDDALTKLQQIADTSEEKNDLAKYEDISNKTKGTELLILEKTKDGDIAKATSLFDTLYDRQQAAGATIINTLVDNETQDFAKTLNENNTTISYIRSVIIITIFIILFVIFIIAYYFFSIIGLSLDVLATQVKKIIGGDLNVKLPVTSQDEIGRLSSSFNDMTSKLQELYFGLEKKVQEKTRQLQEEKAGVEKKVVERTKQLSDEQVRLQASINSLSIGYVMSAVDNSLVLINAAAENIMTLAVPSARPAQNAIDVSSLRGKIDLTFIHNALIGNVNLWQQLETAQKSRKSIILKEVPYKMLYLNLYITPIINNTDNEVIGTVLLIEDTTEQKVLERSRDEFFSIASHELRTPLTAIRGNSAMITDYYSKEITNPDIKEILSDIHESSIRLIDIVNDFLDLSRLEQGKIQYVSEPFELVKLCEEVIKEYDVTGSRKKLALEIEKTNTPIPIVYADRAKLRQVIVNLVSNGIKFTQQGGLKISFTISDHNVKLLFTDTGQGISESNQKLLFRKFQQAESNILTRDNTKGTGLGLYIAKILMSNMGGEIALERSEEGKGSTFSITVPMATEAQKVEYETKQKPQQQPTATNGAQHV